MVLPAGIQASCVRGALEPRTKASIPVPARAARLGAAGDANRPDPECAECWDQHRSRLTRGVKWLKSASRGRCRKLSLFGPLKHQHRNLLGGRAFGSGALGAGCAAGLLLGVIFYDRPCSAEETPQPGSETRGVKPLSASPAAAPWCWGWRGDPGRLRSLCILTHKIDYKQERITLI